MDKPVYTRISESIINQIESGLLQPGDQLPSERKLSDQLGVSRMTVRQALDVLHREGIVERRQGSGTFIAEPKLEQQVDALVGFSESMRQKGLIPGAKLLELEKIPAHIKLAEKLNLNIGHPLYYIHRLRTANGEPIALENSYFPIERCPDIDRFDLTTLSIYTLLEEEYDIHLKMAENILEPIIANEYEADILQIEVGAPLMLVKRVAFDMDDTPIEYARDIYRGDRSHFVARTNLRQRESDKYKVEL